MEHDCEIFDDGEAALDGLLSQAKWADADAGMTARLRGLIVSEQISIAAEVDEPVVIAMAQAEAVADPVNDFVVPMMARSVEIEPADRIERFAEIVPVVEVPPVTEIPSAVEVEQPAALPPLVEIPSVVKFEPVIEPPVAVEISPVEEAEPFGPISLPLEATAVEQMDPVEEVVPPVEESPSADIGPVAEIPAVVVLPTADEMQAEVGLEVPVDIPPLLEEPPFFGGKVRAIAAPRSDQNIGSFPIRRTRPSLAPLLAIAAGFVIMIGIAALLVHRAVQNDISRTASGNRWSQGSLPGRAANPYELWMISPAAEKRRIAEAKSTPPIDPRIAQFEKLCRESDSASLAKSLLEANERDKRVIFDELLSRRDGMDRYLDLIRSPSTRGRAIEVLNGMPNPPTEALLAQLNSPSVARRFAAAKALGTLSNQQTLSQLRRMIEQGDHRREALAVLGECTDPAAQQYVREIHRQPALASEFNVVTREMKQLF